MHSELSDTNAAAYDMINAMCNPGKSSSSAFCKDYLPPSEGNRTKATDNGNSHT